MFDADLVILVILFAATTVLIIVSTIVIKKQRASIKVAINAHEARITELASALQAASNKVHHTNVLNLNFLSILSHEIRTPMNAIVGFSSFLNEADITDERKQEYIALIRNSTLRLISILEMIFDLAQSATISAIPEKVNINKVISCTSAFFDIEKKRLGKTDLAIVFSEGRQNSNVYCYTDSTMFQRILFELFTNALKFTYNGYIEVSWRWIQQDKIAIVIEDSGKGIPGNIKQHIFDAFFMANDHSNRTYSGLGLGLTISHNLAEKLGGTISVDSTIGEGSAFTVTLPCLKPKQNMHHL